MKIHKEKAFLEEITKTLHSYEELIDNTVAVRREWSTYGYVSACRICALYTEDLQFFGECNNCPLNTMKTVGADEFGCTTDACVSLQTKLNSYESDVISIRRAAKARYKEIINHLKKYGIEYK